MNRLYPGWVIVAYAIFCQTLITGVTQASFGLYVVPVSREFGLSRADMNTGIIMLNVGGALYAPIVGWLMDRVPIRPLILTGCAIIAVSFVALGLAATAMMAALCIFPFLTMGLALAGRPETALIVRWFDLNRARALTLGAFGLSLGSLLVSPLIGLSIGTYGWRTTVMLCGGAALVVIALPALLLRLQPTQDELARERPPTPPLASAIGEEAPLPMMGILRQPLFWLIALAGAMPMAISQALLISMVPMAVEHGIPPAQAALIISASGITAFSIKIVVSILANRVNQMGLLMAMFGVGMVENAILFAYAEQASLPVLIACGVMQGMSSGLLLPLFYTLVARIFGRASFGTAMGLMFPVIFAVGALFARLIGDIYDVTGSYRPAFLGFVAVELIAAMLMFAAYRMHRRRAAPVTQDEAGLAPTFAE